MSSTLNPHANNNSRFERIIATLESLGYSVNAHAEAIFRSHLGLAPEADITCLPKKSKFMPLTGDLFELWYPRLFQGNLHGQIADAYFKCFGTRACLISNQVEWRGFLLKSTFPIFIDSEGRIRCEFISFGQHYVHPSLKAYLSESDSSRLVSIDAPDGAEVYDETRFNFMYREARPTILKFYNRVLWSLSWVPGTEIDMGEDI